MTLATLLAQATEAGRETDIKMLAIGGGLAVAVLATITGTIKSIVKTRSREATKREVAAYVAEGSISPDDAERILKADLPAWEKSDWREACRSQRRAQREQQRA